MLFNDDFKNDVYLLQEFTSRVFTSLYNNIRPIIVSIVSLEDLIILFDAFSHNFGMFFIELNEAEPEALKEECEKIKHFWSILFPKENSQLLDDKDNMKVLLNFLIISRHLIRPTILHLIQDIQEKIYFKISTHVKNNFIDIESDFPSFGSYEERLYSKYKHFSLFHYFLKRIVIIHEIFQAKLDDKILPGTARIRLLAFAKKLGYGVEERDYTLDELMNADEIIVHSTGSFCIPVKTVDGKPVGGKAPEMLKTIQDALVKDFEEQCKA